MVKPQTTFHQKTPKQKCVRSISRKENRKQFSKSLDLWETAVRTRKYSANYDTYSASKVVFPEAKSLLITNPCLISPWAFG